MDEKTYTITQAKAQLSALIKKVLESGNEVLIGSGGNPTVKLSPYKAKQSKPRLGLMSGQSSLPDDWKEWPEDLHESLGLK